MGRVLGQKKLRQNASYGARSGSNNSKRIDRIFNVIRRLHLLLVYKIQSRFLWRAR